MSNTILKYIIIFWIICSAQHLFAAQTIKYILDIGNTLEDTGISLDSDADKNIVITGSFRGTVDFDPSAGVTSLTSNGSADEFFAKYDSLGNLIWARSIGGINGEFPSDIMFDPNGDVILAGTFNNTVDFDPTAAVFNRSASNNGAFFAKYDGDDGSLIWVSTIGGTQYDALLGMDIDSDGNIYITGYMGGSADLDPGPGTTFFATAGSRDLYLGKYNNDGEIVWAYMMGSASVDEGKDIKVDASGNVYLAATFMGDFDIDPSVSTTTLSNVNSIDCLLAKFDNNGAFQWARTIGGSGDDNMYGFDTDNSGNIYVTGAYNGTADFDPGPGTDNKTATGQTDLFFAKFSAAGQIQWAHSIGSTTNDIGYNIHVDHRNEIYITGSFSGTVDFDPSAADNSLSVNGGTDAFVARYDSDGNYKDAFNIGGGSNDLARAVISDSDRNVYVTGSYVGNVDFDLGSDTDVRSGKGGFDVFVAVYSQTFPPTLSTLPAYDITQISAFSGGSISDVGNAPITDKGLVWSTSSNPALGNVSGGGFISAGQGANDFRIKMEELSKGNRYYVRAYATNSAGTGYGTAQSFLTPYEIELDGNQDGILDTLQSNVSTFWSYNRASLITIIAPANTTLENVGSLPSDDESLLYPYGLVQFDLAVSSATVKILFHDAPSLNGFIYRKISPENSYYNLSETVIQNEQYGAFSVPTATLQLIDGGQGDLDGEVNGVIKDPGGPAAPTSTIPVWDWWWIAMLLAWGWLAWKRI